ncbi:MAG: DUF3137 domain-containing protein, partial [Parvularculaceae bacterium]|nr:DUF3137 domain-containing protein [Parvularculaceae bacterium]
VQVAALIAMGGGALSIWILDRAKAPITEGLVGRIAGRLGFAYRRTLDRPPYCETLRTLKLIGDFNKERWEDEVSGVYDGVAIRLCEARLRKESGSGKNKRVRTIFHGQIFVIDHPRRFLGSTVLVRDRGPLNKLSRPSETHQRVGLASTAFEKAFEAWSTDQVEAHTLLDPLALERFLELERLYGGKKLRAAFHDGKLFVVVETGDRLDLGTMFEPLADPRRAARILAEFDAVFDLVDVLLKRVDGRLDAAFSLDAVKAKPITASSAGP